MSFAARPQRSQYIPKYGSTAYYVLTSLYMFESSHAGPGGVGIAELERIMKRQSQEIADFLEGNGKSKPNISNAVQTLACNSCIVVTDMRISLDPSGKELAKRLLVAAGRKKTLARSTKTTTTLPLNSVSDLENVSTTVKPIAEVDINREYLFNNRKVRPFRTILVGKPTVPHKPTPPEPTSSQPEPTSSQPEPISSQPELISSQSEPTQPISSPAPTVAPLTAVSGQYTLETWSRNEYKVRVILDNREVASVKDRQGIANDMRNANLDMEVIPLNVGDCLWVAEHTSGRWAVLDWIVERKTLGDLRGSVNDGRYHEQKGRLEKSGVPNIVYLVEYANGVHNNNLYNQNKKMFMTIMSHIAATRKFHLKITKSQSETVAYLAMLTKLLQRKYKDVDLKVALPKSLNYEANLHAARVNNPGVDVAIEYNAFHTVMSKSKMKNIGEVFRLMLRTTRGLSQTKAVSIQSKYPTPSHLFKAYKQLNTEEEKADMLYNATANEQLAGARIGRDLSEKLYEIWGRINE